MKSLIEYMVNIINAIKGINLASRAISSQILCAYGLN